MANSTNLLSKYTGSSLKALKHLNSKQFLEVWNNYDKDGNGFIDGQELDNFLSEFVASIKDCVSATTNSELVDAEDTEMDENLFQELKVAFMDAYDKNRDGRLDINELAQLLPLESSFQLLFKFENQVDSSVDFMRIWTKYDTDSSGYIDADELKNFLRDLIKSNQELAEKEAEKASKTRKCQPVSEEKLDEYTDTLLKIFDSNQDGKLQLSEMTRLLLVRENFLQCSGLFKGNQKELDKEDIERIFNLYDRDANGQIENLELKGFIKDLMDFLGKVPDLDDIEEFQRMVMDGCDADKDGKISKTELTTVLLALSKYASQEVARQQRQEIGSSGAKRC